MSDGSEVVSGSCPRARAVSLAVSASARGQPILHPHPVVRASHGVPSTTLVVEYPVRIRVVMPNRRR
jgi:hypothetical protein